jgi:hypothetical protein
MDFKDPKAPAESFFIDGGIVVDHKRHCKIEGLV